MNIMFDLQVFIQVISPKDIDTISEALKNMGLACRQEKGCIRWEAHHNTKNKTQFILIETWATKEDWENHLILEPFKKFYEGIILPKITREVCFTERL